MGKELPPASVISLDEARAKRKTNGFSSNSGSQLNSGPPNFVYHYWDEKGSHTGPNRSGAQLQPIRTKYSI